jgi:hypothetical protein
VDDVQARQLAQADHPACYPRGEPRVGLKLPQAHHLQRSRHVFTRCFTRRGQPPQAGIDAAPQDRGELLVERRLDPGHIDPGGLGRGPQPRRDVHGQVLGQGRRHREPQPRPAQACRLPGPAHPVIDPRQHRPGLVQQHAARLGQPHALPPALEQRRAHYLLQPPDLLAQRRLRDEHLFRRVRERPGVGHRHEVAQVPQLHALRRDTARIRQPFAHQTAHCSCSVEVICSCLEQ